MQLDYVRVIQGLMVILCAVTYSLIIPMIVKAIGAENFNKIKRITGILVRSIEQTMPEATGKNKKEFVMDKLKETFPKAKESELENMLETAVFEMNHMIDKINENIDD